MEKKSKSSINLLKPIKKFFRQFHLTIFFIFIITCLSGAVLLINNTVNETSTEQYTSSINAGTIDQATLSRLNSLHTSAQGSNAPALPEGRINPFGE